MNKDKTVTYTFKNHTKLTKILVFLLYGYLALSIILAISTLFEYNLLLDLKQGVTVSEEAMDATDLRQGLLSLTWLIVMLSTVIFYCFWLYRAINNARSFNSSDFTLKPNWSVACYFVPFINFYGPYQDMQKLWKVCKNQQHWKNVKSSRLIKWWWFFWITTNILFTGATRIEGKAKTIEELINASLVDVTGYIFEAMCALLLLLLIKEIYKMQTQTYQTSQIAPSQT